MVSNSSPMNLLIPDSSACGRSGIAGSQSMGNLIITTSYSNKLLSEVVVPIYRSSSNDDISSSPTSLTILINVRLFNLC